MIKLENLTPEIYYSASRDFQLIGRLYDTVLNSVKTNTDLIYNIPLSENSDTRLIDLMSTTLGFKSRHKYNVKQLVAICSVFSTVIKQKGTLNAINIAGKALLTAEGITEDIFVETDPDDPTGLTINIFMPQELTDTNLFKDLLLYILPAGCSCNIIRELRETKVATTQIGVNAKATVWTKNIDNTWETGAKWTENTAWSDATNAIPDARVSIIPQPKINDTINTGLTDTLAKGTPGIFINSTVVQPQAASTNTPEEDDTGD